MAQKSTKTGYEVRVKAGHPTGIYRRSGREFTTTTPTVLDQAQMTPAIANDPWLVVTETEIAIEPARRSVGRVARAVQLARSARPTI